MSEDNNLKHNPLLQVFRCFIEVLDYPPYFAIFYISSIFTLFAIITGRFFISTFSVFIYSILGIFWRHIHTDIKKIYNPSGRLDSTINKLTALSYQIGNLLLILLLLYCFYKQGLFCFGFKLEYN